MVRSLQTNLQKPWYTTLLAHSHPGATMAELIDVLATEYRKQHHPEEKAKRAQGRAERVKAKSSTDLLNSPTAQRPQKEESQEGGGHEVEEGKEGENEEKDAKEKTNRFPSQSLVHELTRSRGCHCSFIDPITGKHCSSRWGLEKDHIQAWSLGGKTDLKNLRYLCKNHHRRVSFQQFGESEAYSSQARVNERPR